MAFGVLAYNGATMPSDNDVVAIAISLTVLFVIGVFFPFNSWAFGQEDPPPTSRPVGSLRRGVAWIHLDTKSANGRGVSKSTEDAIDHCRQLANQPANHNDMDAVVERLLGDVSLFTRRSPIVVSGNLRDQAATELRRQMGRCFDIVSFVGDSK